jgi:hypothetical protein
MIQTAFTETARIMILLAKLNPTAKFPMSHLRPDCQLRKLG